MLIPLLKTAQTAAQTGAILVQMATGCPALPEPNIVVSPMEVPLRQDFARDSQEIRQIAGGVYTPFTGTDSALAGLMTGVTRTNIQVDFGGGPIDVPPGATPLACIWPANITIEVTLEPTLYVNRQYPPGTCMHDVVARHEMGHYEIDKATILEHLPLLRNAAAGAVKRIGVAGPLPFEQTRALGDPIGNDIREAIQSVVNQMDTTRRQRNAAHDSPTEQLQMMQACQQPVASPMANPFSVPNPAGEPAR